MSRDVILARVREALKNPAPFPGQHAGADHGHDHGHGGHPEHFERWLPPVGPGYADWVKLFDQCSKNLTTVFQVFPNTGLAWAYLQTVARDNGWKKVAAHKTDLTDAAVQALGLPTLYTDNGYPVTDLEQVDAGITTCEALVAQTGSVVVTSRTSGGRALSVLPPHHVVLARKEQLLPDLTAAFDLLKRKYGGDYPSGISFITGPSRTGDIERILVLGAHGPKKLTILLIEE